VESENDRLSVDNPELSGNPNASQYSDRSQPPAQPAQNVWGDRNQVIGSVSGGNVFGTVETLNQYIQQTPLRFLPKHQLPPDIADFTGRTQEQGIVLTALRQMNSRNVVAISGMAGTGKSALATRVAHTLSAELDEVQLYVNLRGAEDHRAVDPATVLAGWLRALGLDDGSIPDGLEGRVAAYRSLLQGKRAIVLLDNVQNEDQVRPLLPGSATCAVLITSRKTLVALQGVTWLELPILLEEEALSLLKTLIGSDRVEAEPDQAAAMLALCGQLPLAIRIAAGTLNKPSQRQKSLAAYVHQLQDEQQRLTQLNLEHLEESLDVRTSFNLSYRELSDDLASLFRWLGLLDTPDFGIAVAAMLIETDRQTTQQRIDALIDAQLLEIVGESRYRFHDLVRLFAREQLEQIESSERQTNAQQRVIQDFLRWSGFMDGCLHPQYRREIAAAWIADNQDFSLERVEQGLEEWSLNWFEQERPILLTLARWIIDAQRWKQLISLSGNLALFLDRRSYWFDAEQLHLQTLYATQQLGDRSGEGTTLNDLGIVYQSQGKLEEAIALYQQSLAIKQQLGDRAGEGTTLNNLGSIYQSQGKWEEAVLLYKESLKIFRQLDNRVGEGQALNNLGSIYQSQGKWEESILSYQQSLEIAQQLGDRVGEGQVLNNLGIVYDSQGKWEEAISFYQQSLEISRQLGDRSGEGRSLNNLGIVYQSQGRREEAISLYLRSLEISRQLGDLYGQGKSLNNLGIVYHAQGQWQEAIELYLQSLEIKRQLGDLYGEGRSLNNLSNIYKLQGKKKEVIVLHLQNLEIKRQLGDLYGEGRFLSSLGVGYRFQSKWEEAIGSIASQCRVVISRQVGDFPREKLAPDNLEPMDNFQDKRGQAINRYQPSPVVKRWLDDRTREIKFPSDLLAFQQWLEGLQALDRPRHLSRLYCLASILLLLVAALFLISNLLAGRWLVALVILLVIVIAWFGLRAIQRRR
jgi:tetratricopeptide (TPR) repeat protein